MTDKQHREMMIELVAIKEVLEDGFRQVNMNLDGIGLAASQSKDLIESLRTFTVGKITRGG
jgi:uncharacterized radical SAM superfamily Fe-S cluster-containing enzyme